MKSKQDYEHVIFATNALNIGLLLNYYTKIALIYISKH